MNLFAQADAQFWNQWLSGQTGFLLATIIFGLFWWKVLMPRDDRRTKAIEDLADAVKMLVVNALERNGTSGKDIVEKVDEISGR